MSVSGDLPSILEESPPDFDAAHLMPVQHQLFDPGERIPSYESSQEQHERLLLRSNENPAIITTTNLRSRNPTGRTGGTQTQEATARRSLKRLGLRFLNARQHFLLAACRDISLIPPLVGLSKSWGKFFYSSLDLETLSSITSARLSEHFLTGVWCLVASHLLFSVLDGLMVRWIVTYSTTGAIVRMLSMSSMLVVLEKYVLAALTAPEGYNYALHTWILISCALTVLYIGQNFVTLNIDGKGQYRARFFDFYHIAVFAVVPIGLASFITMVGLLRSLIILRLDIDSWRVKLEG